VIEKLKKENDGLREKCEFESRIPKETKTRSVEFREMQNLETQCNVHTQKIVNEKAEVENLTREISTLPTKERDKRNMVRGVFSIKV
jgi:predicted RNase H-like nuclease (RuvC/YqgF family)